MSRRLPPTQPSSVRATMLARALELFFREGYSGHTMERLADRLGVSKRTLYKYFPRKNALLEAALEAYFESVRSQIETLRARNGTYAERLVEHLRLVEASVRPAAPVLLRDILETTPWAWRKIDAFRRTVVLANLEQVLGEGVARGFFRADLAPGVVPLLYTTLVEQIAQPGFLLRWQWGHAELVEVVLSVLLGGILSGVGRRAVRRVINTDGLRTARPRGRAAPVPGRRKRRESTRGSRSR